MFTIIKKRSFNSKGFTVVEALATLALGGLISTMLFMTVSPGLKHMRHLKSTERLHANAIRTADTLSFWIKQGEDVYLTGPAALEIRMDNGETKRVELVSEQIVFDSDPITDPVVKVDSLVFKELAGSVKIDITLVHTATESTSSYSTTIAHRNNI